MLFILIMLSFLHLIQSSTIQLTVISKVPADTGSTIRCYSYCVGTIATHIAYYASGECDCLRRPYENDYVAPITLSYGSEQCAALENISKFTYDLTMYGGRALTASPSAISGVMQTVDPWIGGQSVETTAATNGDIEAAVKIPT
ncbi:unnamed protein product, partial [Mesorhabditis spiculigera]